MPLLAAWSLFRPGSEPLRMGVFFNGGEVGESTYESLANGGFRTIDHFAIGPTKIDGTVEGVAKNGKIVQYSFKGQTGTLPMSLEYSSGRLTYLKSGKKGELAYTIAVPTVASLYPQLTAAFLTKLRDMKPGEERQPRVYLVDAGVEVPIRVKSQPEASVRVRERDERVHRFALTFGATEIDYDLNATGDVVAMDVPGQRLRFIVPGWERLFDDEATKHSELSQPTFTTERLRRLRMRTRDGVTLVADVVRPVGEGRYPAILERTPYGRETPLELASYWAARGYVYVAQDCRGRGDSDGAWDPFVHEGRDGYDAVEWVAKQPWCDGKVGMIGGSYAGTLQWQAAIERPEALRCIVPQVSAPDAMHNLPYEYGTFFLYGSVWWSRIVAGKATDLMDAARPLPNPKGFAHLPVGMVDRAVLGRSTPVFQSWIRRPLSGDWSGFDFEPRIAQAKVPALHISGWWDGDGIGTKLAWEAMRRAGRTDQWLVDGPWTHAFNTTTRLGDEDYGPNARYDLDGLTLRFFDTFLKGRSVGMDAVPRVQAFVTGANRWMPMDGWPASNSTLETLFLTPTGLAPKPGEAGAAVYTYDPAKDTSVAALQKGEASSRIDLPPKGTYVVFRGEPLAKPTALGGPFEVRLFFKSGAVDTDLFAFLLDIAPDGTMRAIGQPGKIRASYRESLAHPKPLRPGQVATALLHPWDSARELPTGHRIGLLVSSSMFPIYARNLGTGESLVTGKRMVKQRNAILTGALTPSRITFRKLW